MTNRPALSQDIFHGCGMGGKTKQAWIKAQNQLKNRYTPPTDAEVDSSVTLKQMLQLGNDLDRFDENSGAEIVGYVRLVKAGGLETCNCKAPNDDSLLDTHIELIPKPNLSDPTHRVIVEVSPRLRARTSADGLDWSTNTLKATLTHHWVKVRGWMFPDIEHKGQATHTDPGGTGNWRATVWEVHPITSIEITTAPP